MSTKTQNKNTENLFDALNPGNMVSNAQKVLSAAVNVLEEEIAAGILAAKKIETKIIDVEDIRENPQDLMNRIRRDVHEAVDLLMDSVAALTKQFKDFSQNINKVKSEEREANDVKQQPSIPVIKSIKPAAAGELLVLKVTVTNNDNEEPETISFQKADILGTKGFKIAARNITFSPASVTLNSGEEKEVAIKIKIPKLAASGQYSALLIDANNSSNKIIIHVDIL